MNTQTSLNLRNLADTCSELVLGDKLAWQNVENFEGFIADVIKTLYRGVCAKNAPEFICSTEFFNDCPVHDGSFVGEFERFNSIEDIKEYALESMNDTHIVEIEHIFGDIEYHLRYESAGHSYVRIKLYKNDKLISETVDNGSGTNIWQDVENDM